MENVIILIQLSNFSAYDVFFPFFSCAYSDFKMCMCACMYVCSLIWVPLLACRKVRGQLWALVLDIHLIWDNVSCPPLHIYTILGSLQVSEFSHLHLSSHCRRDLCYWTCALQKLLGIWTEFSYPIMSHLTGSKKCFSSLPFVPHTMIKDY